MGAIATTTDPAKLDSFLSRVTSAQTSLIQAIRANDSLRASFADAEARMIVLESIEPNVAAYLLRFCDPRLSMVEVVNTGDKDRMVQVMALAILNGFVPGRDQFGIHSGKLYVKEAGYRKLFTTIGDCGPADVSVGHPEFADLGNGKKVWRVDGVASVTFRGTEHVVECVQDYAVGLPGHATDNIDGIKAKARRRLLQLLWKKVSAIGLDDSEDDYITSQPSVQVVEPPKQIADATPAEATTIDPPRGMEGWQESRKSLNKMLSKDPSEAATVMELWDAIAAAETNEALEETGKTIGELKAHFSARVVDELRILYVYRQQCLKEAA
jgi:hypothetical protein